MRASLALLLVAALGAAHIAAAQDTVCGSYVVQNGDSLWSISEKFGILQDDLTTVLATCISGYDPTTGPPALQPGQSICLPGWVPSCVYVTNAGDVSTCKAYKVQAGDTMTSVAAAFNLYQQDLEDLNNDLIDAERPMRAGGMIRLPEWDLNNCPDPGADAPSCRVYTVKEGDYISRIVGAFQTTVENFLAVNTDLTSVSTLRPGQKVQIPPFPAKCGKGVEAEPPTDGVTTCRLYKVLPGDTLSLIAQKFTQTINDVVSVNPELTDPSLLTPGKTVKVAPWDSSCSEGVLVSGLDLPPGPPAVIVQPTSPAPVAVPTIPSPVVVSPVVPSPSPVVVPTVPTAAPTAMPTTSIEVEVTLTGTSVLGFNDLTAKWITAMATAAQVPASYVTISNVVTATGARRLQAATDSVTVKTTIATATPASTTQLLQSAASDGTLAAALTPLGLSIGSNGVIVSTTGAAVSAPAPAPVTAPAPVPVESTSSGGSSVSIGAIVGGVVGGIAVVAIAAALTMFFVNKKKAAAAQRSVAHGGVSASINTSRTSKGELPY